MTRVPIAKKYWLTHDDRVPNSRKNTKWLKEEMRLWLDARDIDCVIVNVNHSESTVHVDFKDDGDAVLFKLTFPVDNMA